MQINQQTEIKKLWHLKTAKSNCILELRAIAPNKPPITKILGQLSLMLLKCSNRHSKMRQSN